MKRNNNYTKAIEQAKANAADIKVRGTEAIGDDALVFLDSMMTPEETAESDLRVAIIGELINARETQGISQRKLEELSGVKQPVISRVERGITDPHISTLMKLLAPLGKTLAIVPLKDS